MADWYFRGSGGNLRNNLVVCPGCRNLVRREEEFCPFCAKRLRPENGLASWLRRYFHQPDAMTRLLLGALAVVYLLQFVADFLLPPMFRGSDVSLLGSLLSGASGFTYIRMGSNFHSLTVEHAQYWRWLSYCFLHIGILHILFNGWAFWDLGRLVERLWGARQVFTVFILTGIAGGALSTLVNYLLLGNPGNSAGASGSICGVLGLLLGAYYKNRYHVGEFLGTQLVRWAVMILVFGLVIGADNAAHVGGMLSGAALGYFLPPTDKTRTPERDAVLWRALTAVAGVFLILALTMAILFYAQGPLYAAALL